MAAGFKEFFDLLSPKAILLIFADMHHHRRKHEFSEDLEKLLDKVARYIDVVHPEFQDIAIDISNGKLQTYPQVIEALGLISEEEKDRRLVEELKRELERVKVKEQEVDVDREKERERQLRDLMKRDLMKKQWEQWEHKTKNDESKMLDDFKKFKENQDNIFDSWKLK